MWQYSLLIQWLETELLDYLREWEASVKARQGFDKKEKNKMLLSQETLTGKHMRGKMWPDFGKQWISRRSMFSARSSFRLCSNCCKMFNHFCNTVVVSQSVSACKSLSLVTWSLCLGGWSHGAYSSRVVYVSVCLSVCQSAGFLVARWKLSAETCNTS